MRACTRAHTHSYILVSSCHHIVPSHCYPTHANTTCFQVESSIHAAKITVMEGLVGDATDTEAIFFIHVDPPANSSAISQ